MASQVRLSHIFSGPDIVVGDQSVRRAGTPFRLGGFASGELSGPNYYVATGGCLRRIGRLPDFVGGPVFAGAWLENGDAFDAWRDAGWRTNGGAGVMMDTIVGPVLIAGSWGFDGRFRLYLSIGRLFR